MIKPKIVTLTLVLTIATCLLPCGYAESFNRTYQLLDRIDGSPTYMLSLTIQQSLYEYYKEKSHSLTSENDFAKFVTPYALKPIADSLEKIYTDDEDFTNAVLMILHQIPYEVTAPAKYSVETIVENKGDCDLFSFIAASIIKAAEYEVALLYYESQSHMNIGVKLSHSPYYAREQAYFVSYNGVDYYVAETTGDNWQDGWRVGECPTQLKTAPVQVITLENSDESTYGQVSASYKTLSPSSISLIVSSTFLIQGSSATLSGELSPSLQNEEIVIYIKVNNSPWTVLDAVKTDQKGTFTCTWNVESTGVCYVRASWSGNDDYGGADSSIQTVTVFSTYFVLLLAFIVVLACIGVAVLIISRRTQPQTLEPQPPEATLATKRFLISRQILIH